MKYKYTNLDSKKEIEIKINQKYAFIYGPNGTGKTTFSRAINKNPVINENGIDKIHLVFNQDFVNNNIYISTVDNGYKLDSKNKAKLKHIFLGDTSKEDNELLNFLRRKSGEYARHSIDINIFRNDFKSIVVNLLKNEKEYNIEFEQFIMNYIDDELLSQYVNRIINSIDREKFEIDLSKLEDEKYMKELNIPEILKTYTEEEVIEELISFLKDMYYKQEQSINKRIDILNNNIKEVFTNNFIEEKKKIFKELIEQMQDKKQQYRLFLKLQGEENEFLEEILKDTSINIGDVRSWISNGHKYHEPIDFKQCLYCGNSISQEKREEYKTMIKNAYIKYFNQYKDEVNTMKSIIDSVESEYNEIVKYDWYIKTKRERESKFIRIMIKKINRVLRSCEEEIRNKNYYSEFLNEITQLQKYINLTEILIVHKEQKSEEKEAKFRGYQLYLDSNKFIRQIKVELIKEKISKEVKKLEEKIKNDTNEYISKIEDYVTIFEEIYEPRIKLKLKSNLSRAYNAEAMIEITSTERDFLNNISDGEKNVLALTIFFSYVKNTIQNLKENEKIIIVLDDPVNSNDWGNFFKFQAIIEDYFWKDVNITEKIDKIIILSHNIDYAIIQLQNDKYLKNFEFKRLFNDKCEDIDTNFIFMDDVRLGGKLVHNLLNETKQIENKVYINKRHFYRVAIYMRKFLESIITSNISIAEPKKNCEDEECIKFLKENINSENINEFLDISTNIIKKTNKEIYEVNEYMHKMIIVMKEIILNYKIFREESNLVILLNKLDDDSYTFFIEGEEELKIRINTFDIDYNQDYNEILIDTMLKGIITQIHVDKKNDNEVLKVKKKSNIYFLNYLRHVNDNVGRPVLAVNSDRIINNQLIESSDI